MIKIFNSAKSAQQHTNVGLGYTAAKLRPYSIVSSTAVWPDGEAERVIVWVFVLHPSAARDFYLHSSMKLEWRASTIEAGHPPIGN
jgi:hypothetical protein